ncbi:MAG: chemotaxis protein CheW [Anaerolineae bacterium]|jgi:purine-binding chemotaxis protein CheW|nr:MAG: chemotaxis protein CheW [Anaerolineae bacterium]
MDNQVVIFELGGEQFGVAISAVESIVQMLPITHIPQAPAYVRGVTNLRGRVLPVLDLHTRFGLKPKADSKQQRIVVLQWGNTEAGIIVDAVTEVITLDPAQVEPPPPLTRTVASEFVEGIAKLGERMVILLDLRKVLSSEEEAPVAMLAAPTAAD